MKVTQNGAVRCRQIGDNVPCYRDREQAQAIESPRCVGEPTIRQRICLARLCSEGIVVLP
jgi:hypothetical protein